MAILGTLGVRIDGVLVRLVRVGMRHSRLFVSGIMVAFAMLVGGIGCAFPASSCFWAACQ
jgi:hypothetical protein